MPKPSPAGRIGEVPIRLAPPPRPAQHARPPAPLTPLIGREAELASLLDLFVQQSLRLVTLTGPAGAGKTRLALEAAARLERQVTDGVWFVPLAHLRDASQVLPAVARSLGMSERADQPLAAQLAAHLRHRDLLLLIDNFEHVLAAGPDLAAVLAACPGVRALVTSRTALRVAGEREVPVRPFPVAAPGADAIDRLREAAAIRLFIARMRGAAPGFAPDAADTLHIAAICHRLDGLPLAIELAAAQCNVLTPATLLERLERRLPLLTGGPRDHPARLQTMRDAVAWSYDLLSAEERRWFRRLAIFNGGFTLDAAAAVLRLASPDAAQPSSAAATEVLNVTGALLDKSLVHRQPIPGHPAPRFMMLETIREFGLEQLATDRGAGAARRRYAGYFLALAETAAAKFGTDERERWLDQLDADQDNLRTALEWFTDHGHAGHALRLGGALWRFWYGRGHLSEGRRRLDAALALPGAAPSVRIMALIGAGYLAWAQGDLDRAAASFERGLAMANQHADDAAIARALDGLGRVASYRSPNPAAARPSYEQALVIHRALGDRGAAAKTLYFLGVGAGFHGDYAIAHQRLTEALTVFRELGDRESAADALGVLGMVALGQDDLATARLAVEEANAIMRELALRPGIAKSLTVLGDVLMGQGAIQSAGERYREALTLLADLDDRWWLAWCLESVAGLAAAHGQHVSGSRLLGAAAALRRAIAAPQPVIHQAAYDRTLAAVRDAAATMTFETAWESGQRLPLADAIAEARLITARAAEGGGPAPDAADVGLTDREQEVLRLLATGRSDRQIADALFLSPRTVQTHVAHLRAKFAVTSRTEVAALARQRDLV